MGGAKDKEKEEQRQKMMLLVFPQYHIIQYLVKALIMSFQNTKIKLKNDEITATVLFQVLRYHYSTTALLFTVVLCSMF